MAIWKAGISAPSCPALAARLPSCPSAAAIALRNACASANGSPAPRAAPDSVENTATGPAANPPDATLPVIRSSAMRIPGRLFAEIRLVPTEVQFHEIAQRGQRRARVRTLGPKMQGRAFGRLYGHDLHNALGIHPRAVRARRDLDLRRESLRKLGELDGGTGMEPDRICQRRRGGRSELIHASASNLVVARVRRRLVLRRRAGGDRLRRRQSWRQFLGRAPHSGQARAPRGFGRGDHRPFDDRRVAYDDTPSLVFGEHLYGHLAVGLRAAEIDEERDAGLRPRAVNGVRDRLETRSEPP